MLRALPVLALMIAGLALSAAATTAAQEAAQEAGQPLEKIAPAFVCSAQTEGQMTCQANRQCRCLHRPAASSSGLPARWAWDCGIMRPRCEVTPAEAGEGAYPLPPVIIERREGNKEGGGE